MTSGMRPPRPALIFLAFFLLYMATSSGGLHSSDALLRYETARSWLDGRGGAVTEGRPWTVATGRDGRLHGLYGPLQSALMAPFAALSRMLPCSDAMKDPAARFVISLALFPSISALALLLVHLSLLRLEFAPGTALASTATIGVCTIFWHYASSGHEENLLALGYGLWLYGTTALERGSGKGLVTATAGACVVLATRLSAAPVLLVLLCVTLVLVAKSRVRVPPAIILACAALGLVCLLLLGFYNAHRFGSPLASGYSIHWSVRGVRVLDPVRLKESVPALLFSPGKGWFVFSPALALALVSIFRRAGRSRAPYAAAAWGALLALLVTVGSFVQWAGGLCWGPRYVTGILVLFGPVVALALERAKWARPLLIVSALLQLLSVTLPGQTEPYLWAAGERRGARPCTLWQWRCSPVIARGPLAAQAVRNTALAIPGRILGDRETVSAAEALATSDYRTLFWWPFRLAFRLRLFPLPVAFALSALCWGLTGLAWWRLHRNLGSV